MTILGDSDWWRDYFDEDFLRIYRDVLDPNEPAVVADAAREILGLPSGARVLDLACGWGRHSLALRDAGFTVVGVDRSLPLLREAASSRPPDDVSWASADLRHLPFASGSFDAVVCLFSSLGYFLSDDDDVRVLEEVRRVLAPGGPLLIETVHRDAAVRDYAERDWWMGSNGETVFVERDFDAVEGVTRETLRWTRTDGSTGEKRHAARIRTATEWQRLLRGAGLQPIAWYGSWELQPFDHTAEILIVHAEPG